MFDNVGKGNPEATKRQASSLLASVVINGSIIGLLVYLGQQVVDEVQDDSPVEVTLFESAPPPPPPPPPPPGGKKKTQTKKKEKPKEEKPEEVEPDIEDVVELEPEPDPEPEEIPEELEEEGEEGGQEGGQEGGVIGGVVGGVIGGVIGGELGSNGFSAVHWSDVKIKRRVAPKMPQAAKALNITEENCQVRFYIDLKGNPEKIDILKCSKIFHDSLMNAAEKWRFYPMKSANGQKVKATFILNVKFRLK